MVEGIYSLLADAIILDCNLRFCFAFFKEQNIFGLRNACVKKKEEFTNKNTKYFFPSIAKSELLRNSEKSLFFLFVK